MTDLCGASDETACTVLCPWLTLHSHTTNLKLSGAPWGLSTMGAMGGVAILQPLHTVDPIMYLRHSLEFGMIQNHMRSRIAPRVPGAQSMHTSLSAACTPLVCQASPVQS